MGSDFFVVESMRHCFICLHKICRPTTEVEPESISFSIQFLSRFLSVDMGTVFHEIEAVPLHFLDKAKQSKLKVELCQECSVLNGHFSNLYRQLEKIKMEVESVFELVNRKLSKVETFSKLEKLKELADSLPNDSREAWKSKLDILEAVRTKVVKKCFKKLARTTPRVKLRHLTTRKAVNAKKLDGMKPILAANSKFFQSTLPSSGLQEALSNMDVETNPVKVEYRNVEILDGDDDEDNVTMEHLPPDNSKMDVEEDKDDLGTPAWGRLKEAEGEGNPEEQAVTTACKDSYEIVVPEGSSSSPTEQSKFIIDPNTKKFKCANCSMEFKDKRTCERHYGSIHLKLRYRCKLCGREFNYKSRYYVHYNVDHVGRRFRCGVCNTDFKERSCLIRHQHKSTSCKPGEGRPKGKEIVCRCEVCGKGFTLTSNLRKHVKEVHMEREKPACKVCGKEFSRERYLRIHEKNVCSKSK